MYNMMTTVKNTVVNSGNYLREKNLSIIIHTKKLVTMKGKYVRLTNKYFTVYMYMKSCCKP